MKHFSLLCAASLVLAASAAAQDVRFNFDQEADFTKYKTFKLVEARGAQTIDDLQKRQLVDAITEELAKKGLTKTEDGTADLHVAYQVAISTEKQMDTWNDGWGMGPRWGGGWYGGGPSMSQTTTSTLYIGELALDMYETPSKHLVWRGVASKTIDPKAKPDKREKNLHKALQKMLKNYPPKKKS